MNEPDSRRREVVKLEKLKADLPQTEQNPPPNDDDVARSDDDDWLNHPPKTFKEYILNGPVLSDLDLDRDQSPPREFDW